MPHITLTVVQHFGIDCFEYKHTLPTSQPQIPSNADTNMLILFNLAKIAKLTKKNYGKYVPFCYFA